MSPSPQGEEDYSGKGGVKCDVHVIGSGSGECKGKGVGEGEGEGEVVEME